jgi:predicted O-methyltransferase YrrM
LGDIKKMQISISQCQFLELIIKVSNSKKILEIGTFTGLSALSMSLALPEDGQIIALDKNTETNKTASEFFKKAKQENKIKTIIKPALESLSDLKKKNKLFDLVFIDADKDNYKNYYDYAINLTSKESLIIIDNVLWHGEVADEKNDDKFTNIIRDFNKYVKNDKQTEQIIIPLGDGLTVCRKL